MWFLKKIKKKISHSDITLLVYRNSGFPGGTSGKEPRCQCRGHKRHEFNPWVGKIPLEKEMATHSTISAWEILWTEEHGGLQSKWSQRVRHDWSDWAHTHIQKFNRLLNINLVSCNLTEFTDSNSFWVEILGFSIWNIMSSLNSDTFTCHYLHRLIFLMIS